MSANLAGNCTEIHNDDTASTRIKPMEASMQTLKNGHWFMSKKTGQPGTMSSVKMSKTGKHGHAKFTFQVSYPFTEQTSQEMHPGHTHLTKPIVKKFEWMVSMYDPDTGEVTCINDDDAEQTLTMNAEYVDKSGKEVGKLFSEAYD